MVYADHVRPGLKACCGVGHIADERQVGIDAVVASQAFGRNDPALVSRNLRDTSLPEPVRGAHSHAPIQRRGRGRRRVCPQIT